MVMGGAYWRGGSQEVPRPTAIAWFKMEDVCIFCNVLENFLRRKITKTKIGRPSGPLKFHMALAQSCKNTSACLFKHPNASNGND
jgi:hypothetical protein